MSMKSFVGEIGGEDRLEAYDFDGTVGSAKRILKDDVEYEEYMFDQYTKGKLIQRNLNLTNLLLLWINKLMKNFKKE